MLGFEICNLRFAICDLRFAIEFNRKSQIANCKSQSSASSIAAALLASKPLDPYDPRLSTERDDRNEDSGR
jgi:hypothetical protein